MPQKLERLIREVDGDSRIPMLKYGTKMLGNEKMLSDRLQTLKYGFGNIQGFPQIFIAVGGRDKTGLKG
jgi:hypothetical protein